jgi:hypothetical protein
MDCFIVDVSTICDPHGVVLRGSFQLQAGDSEVKAMEAVEFLLDGLRARVGDVFHPDRCLAWGGMSSVVHVHTQNNMVLTSVSSI